MTEVNKAMHDCFHTRLFHEDEADQRYGAPHHYVVTRRATGETLCKIDLQEGPVRVAGVNGATNEDLLNIVADRLKHFQQGSFHCEENDMALRHVTEALLWLYKRTVDRTHRGVEGTDQK